MNYWILRICARALLSLDGLVRFNYGDGYKTTVLLGGASEEDEPVDIGVHLCCMSKSGQMLILLNTDLVRDHLLGLRPARGILHLYVNTRVPTGNIFAPEREPRMIRVYPRPENRYQMERLEVVESAVVAEVVPAAAPEEPAVAPRQYIEGLDFIKDE